jgi:prephenate dehydrogenase
MRLAVVGVGLIGGSIARAVRERRRAAGDDWLVVGWSPKGRGSAEALAAGAIDQMASSLREAAYGADLVVLAAPPLACLDLLGELADEAGQGPGRGTVVTDVASTKAAIVARAEELGLPFVGGHPMAGSERSGFGAASADLFAGRPWIVTPTAVSSDAAIDRVEELARACGARPVRMDAASHDRAVALVSHLPLLVSAALAETATTAPAWPDARTLAASGWRDTTRLARGDVEMAAGIAATNAAAVAESARDLRRILDAWIEALERPPGPDADELRERFAAARRGLGDD